MFRFICKTLHHPTYAYTCPYNPSSSSSSSSSSSLLRYFSSDSADDPHSFTVSYLTNTCGLSPKSALSACKTVRFQSSDQPDSVLSCFLKLGFSKTHISQMITKFPRLLSFNPDKTISPKVDFFLSKGASTSDLVKIFTLNPKIFERSLQNQLLHTYNILIQMFQSQHIAIQLIKHNPYALHNSPEAALIPNVATLRKYGVPVSNILWLIRRQWLCILSSQVKFKNVVEEVKEMGFHPLKLQFVGAIIVLTLMSKSNRDRRVELFKRWGWSDKDITTAFKKNPWYMSISEDKLMAVMDFYVKKLGIKSSVIINCPTLLGYSVKKRLIPRGVVIQYLSSKGLLKLDSNVTSMFICPEMRFLEKYVKCHEEAPHLMKLYNDKLNEAIDEGERKI